ncbi:mustard isoform v [Anaeramoeba flamelloides]|uniref:Mustard isoform v n=1 Tax=Anaeramoeba flamelloides TaxID=1746091 RepID=A0AAV7ZMS7_9EUKA|nr:mustard isoform v [Anaeramoeba flamelloides]
MSTDPTPLPNSFKRNEKKIIEYVVQPRETLSVIAIKFGMNIGKLKTLNRLYTNRVFPGKKLFVFEPEEKPRVNNKNQSVDELNNKSKKKPIIDKKEQILKERSRLQTIMHPVTFVSKDSQSVEGQIVVSPFLFVFKPKFNLEDKENFKYLSQYLVSYEIESVIQAKIFEEYLESTQSSGNEFKPTPISSESSLEDFQKIAKQKLELKKDPNSNLVDLEPLDGLSIQVPEQSIISNSDSEEDNNEKETGEINDKKKGKENEDKKNKNEIKIDNEIEKKSQKGNDQETNEKEDYYDDDEEEEEKKKNNQSNSNNDLESQSVLEIYISNHLTPLVFKGKPTDFNVIQFQLNKIISIIYGTKNEERVEKHLKYVEEIKERERLRRKKEQKKLLNQMKKFFSDFGGKSQKSKKKKMENQNADPLFSDYSDDEIEMIGQSKFLQKTHIESISKALPLKFSLSAWKLVYSSLEDGFSLTTFFDHTSKYKNSIFVVQNENSEICGAYISTNWRQVKTYYGNSQMFLFSFFKKFNVFRPSNKNGFFVNSSKNGISFGGGNAPALWIDSNLDNATTEMSDTFDNHLLCSKPEFHVIHIEVWAFVN